MGVRDDQSALADVKQRLAGLADAANQLGDADRAAEALAVAERVGSGRFFVVCVGQFKRGKSTLIDALLGDPVLPAGIAPVTTVPTVVRHGDGRGARVQDRSGRWTPIPVSAVAEYVSEECNPGNEKGIVGVEVSNTSSLLASGLCLIDTPGLGSVFDANTRATLAFAPHIDVALVVIGTDPPISGDELRLIANVGHEVSDLLVVLNKADRSTADERAQACAFARRVIAEGLGRSIGKIYEVSARDQLERSGEWPDWRELVAALERLSGRFGTSIAVSGGRRAVARIGARLRTEIARYVVTLIEPVEAADAQIARLTGLVDVAERRLDELAPVLAAHERQIAGAFSRTANTFLRDITPSAHAMLAERLGQLPAFGPRIRRVAMARAQDVAAAVIGAWLTSAEREAATLHEQVMRRFADASADLWRSIQQSGVAELETLPDLEDIRTVIGGTSRFRFNEQLTTAQPASPLRYAADVVLALIGRRSTILADAHRFLDWLLELNVGRAESDLVERVVHGRQALERSLRSQLGSVRERAARALIRTKHVRAHGVPAVEREFDRLSELRVRISVLSRDEAPG